MKTSPTLTGDLRRGDETQVLLKLQQDGVEPDDYAAILKHRLFTPPEEQVKRLLEINERVWKDTLITEAGIRALGDPPTAPASSESGLYCVTLLSETGDALRTFERNWAACVQVIGQEKTGKWNSLVFSSKGVKPRNAAKPRKPGLRWAICELGRTYKGQCVRDVRPDLDRKERQGLGQELPGIGAMHPRWATSMNGDAIPYLDAPDLEVAPSAKGKFVDAPYLEFYRADDTVRLSADSVGHPSSDYGSGSLR